MNGSNVELVLSLYQALRERDLPSLLKANDPEVVIFQTEQLPWGGVYQGETGFKAFFGNVLKHIESQVTVNEIFEAGDRVVVIGRTVGKTRQGNAPFDVRLVHLWTVRAGTVMRFEALIDTPEMLRILRTPAPAPLPSAASPSGEA